MLRKQALHHWISTLYPNQSFNIEVASADASFRRYFRVQIDTQSYIAMDAPPEHENCEPFVRIARLFEQAGVHTPHIIAEDLNQGFLLLSDLGNTTYMQALNQETASPLYLDAIDALIKIQLASVPDVLPEYDAALLLRELQLFPDWYIQQHLKTNLSEKQQQTLKQVFSSIIDNNLAQAKVFVHRDYHCRNLMLAQPNPGVLDFQDAVYGPITYDLVSLFKDAYIEWEEAQVLDWTIRYWERARQAGLPVAVDFADFYHDFEWMGVQRHLKVLGIFARLCHRDGKQAYVNDMPLVMRYLRKTCARYIALRPLLRLLDELEGATAPEVGYTF